MCSSIITMNQKQFELNEAQLEGLDNLKKEKINQGFGFYPLKAR